MSKTKSVRRNPKALDAEDTPRDTVEPPEDAPRDTVEPPPRRELPDRSIYMTAERCLLARSRDPVVTAFLHVERMRPVRKLTREQWDQELENFKGAPR